MSKSGRQWTNSGINSPEFVNNKTKRKAKNKVAKQARKKNRSK